MSDPAISVVVPTFNSASVVKDTLASVQAQTFRDFEAIVVDDGSSDGTADIAARFCAQDSRFIFIAQKNSGVSAARNAGIQRARGEWVALLDGDDLWLPKKLQRQMEMSREKPDVDLLFTNYYFWDGQQDLQLAYPPEHPLPEGDVMRLLLFSFLFLPSTILARRQKLIDAGMFDSTRQHGEDWDLYFRLALCGSQVHGTREPLVRYRIWPQSVSVTKRLAMLAGNVEVVKKHFTTVTSKYPQLQAEYLRAITMAENIYDLAEARAAMHDFKKLSELLWKRWQRQQRWKWLCWNLFIQWPAALGGNATRRYVQKKLAIIGPAENFKNKWLLNQKSR